MSLNPIPKKKARATCRRAPTKVYYLAWTHQTRTFDTEVWAILVHSFVTPLHLTHYPRSALVTPWLLLPQGTTALTGVGLGMAAARQAGVRLDPQVQQQA